MGLLDRSRRELDDALVVVRAGAGFVLGRRQAEQEHGGDPELLRFVRLLDRVVDREMIDPRHLLDRLALVDPVRDEHRIHEVGGAEMGLSDETAQRVRGA